MKVLPKFRGSSRRTKLLNPFRLSFSNKLFIFCSILSVIFPTLASISQWITARDDEHVCQLSECVWKPSHLSYSTFNLATGRADYTSKLSLLKCNIRSIIYEPRVYKVRKTRKVEGVPNGRLLGLVHVILSYALITILLIGTVLTLLVTVCTNGDIFDLKENPVLVILTIVVLMSLESSCVTGAMSYSHSSQGEAGSKYHGVGYQVTNCNRLTSIIVGGLSCRPYAWTRKLVGMLLLLSGDVECNPGPPPPVDKTCSSDANRNPGPPPPVDKTCSSDADRNPGPLLPVDEMCSSDPKEAEENSNDASNGRSDSVSNSQSNPKTTSGFSDKDFINIPKYEPPATSPLDDGKKSKYDIRRNQTSTSRLPVRTASLNICMTSSHEKSKSKKFHKSQTYPNFHGLRDVHTSYMDELKKRKNHKIPYLRHQSYPMCDEQVTDRVVKQNSVEPPGDPVFQENDEYKQNLKKKVNKFIDDLKEKKRWSEQDGFLKIEDSKCELLPSKDEMGHFYLLTNQLYRARGECAVCLLCGRSKEAVSCEKTAGVINSHIFPKCLLKVYRDIHCNGESQCIYDPSTKQKMGPARLTIALFCSTCEKEACLNEKLLRDLYISVVYCNATIITMPDAVWLTQISATLVFRGMLTGINVLKEMRHDRWTSLMGTMSSLRSYILGIGPLPQALALYLLPNGPFNPNNTDPLFIYDYVLRCPSFTSVIQCENKTFLYTKFDCFHWVLPLDNHKISLKKDANCFCKSPGNDLIMLKSSGERKLTFPRLLLKVCALQSVEREMTFLDNKCIERYYGMVIERFRGSNLTDTSPLNLQWLKETPDKVEEKCFRSLQNDDSEKMIKSAKILSPLNGVKDGEIETLQADKTALKEQNEFMRNDRVQLVKKNRSQEVAIQTMGSDNKKLVTKNGNLKSELESLKAQLKCREGELESLKAQSSADVDQDIISIPVGQPPAPESQVSQEETRNPIALLKSRQTPYHNDQ